MFITDKMFVVPLFWTVWLLSFSGRSSCVVLLAAAAWCIHVADIYGTTDDGVQIVHLKSLDRLRTIYFHTFAIIGNWVKDFRQRGQNRAGLQVVTDSPGVNILVPDWCDPNASSQVLDMITSWWRPAATTWPPPGSCPGPMCSVKYTRARVQARLATLCSSMLHLLHACIIS